MPTIPVFTSPWHLETTNGISLGTFSSSESGERHARHGDFHLRSLLERCLRVENRSNAYCNPWKKDAYATAVFCRRSVSRAACLPNQPAAKFT